MKISISNIGPVRQASIELKPLVIFIGPNNAGKSYAATVMYASLSQTGAATSSWLTRSLHKATLPQVNDEAEADFGNFLAEALSKEDPPSFDMIPGFVRDIFQDILTDSLLEYSASISAEITRTVGVPWPMVRRVAGEAVAQGSVEIASGSPRWAVRLEAGASPEPLIELAESADLGEVWSLVDSEMWRRMTRSVRRQIPVSRQPSLSFSFPMTFRAISSELVRICFREIPLRSEYLPAARSGILQSYKTLAGSLVRRATLAGREDMRIPVMSGVVTDFVGEMIELSPAASGDFTEEALMLESEILHGRIELAGEPPVTPEVVYSTANGEYPLGRTSSMVSELAPVVLYLRHRLHRDDLLFIEEPEAHLHPASQVILARSLAGLVNSGLRIVLTTHSEFFLQQVNNSIMAAGAGTPGVASTEFPAKYSLSAGAVAAYFFEPAKSGTMVKELAIDDKEGIAESSFSSVSEQLYNQAVALDRSDEDD